MMDALRSLIGTALPFAWLHYDFMKNAFLAILLSAPILGLLSTLVVQNRMAFFSDALGHAGLTGIALGAILGLADPAVALVAFSVIMALSIVAVLRRGSAGADTVIGAFSSTAIALGLVLLSSRGSMAKLSSYLAGDVLAVTGSDILRLAILALFVLLFFVFFADRLVLQSVSESLAKSRAARPLAGQICLALALAVAVALSIRWIGILLINSFLVLPAATSRNLSRSLGPYRLISVILALVCGVLGLALSYYLNAATGAVIVLCLALAYFLSLAFRKK